MLESKHLYSIFVCYIVKEYYITTLRCLLFVILITFAFFFIIEYGLCSVPFESKLYLVGGQTTITECYDPEQNEWREIASMMERRMECGAVIMNGCIYVTGGYSYSKGTYLQSIEKYDPDLNKWEIVGNLPSAMRSHGCVCVYNV